MPSLTITVDTGAGTRSITKQISAANLDRLAAALKNRYGEELTNAQVLDKWFAEIMENARNTVKRHEMLAGSGIEWTD